jgi:pimeloyl-ACP methyl ester carboxylesterase
MPATTVAATTDPATTTSGSTRLATTEVTVAATVTTPIAAPPRPTAPVDELVSVGGARMHVRCAGSGDATVVLIAGFTGDHSDFVDIEPRLTEVARVCSYDRFGTGFSDPAPISQTFATQARDLRDALETLGEPGPFVAVGHSFGGAVAVTFTSLDPGDVGGLLLLDASPATWNATVCSVAQDGSATADMWMRTCAMQDPANNVEALDGPAAFAEVATIRSLGDVPMIVATASDHDYTADDFDPASGARLTQAWFDGQDHWASLSSNSQLISVDSGHYIQSDQPDLVIEQINGLLQLVS